jgi:hypothetical protein
MKARMLKAHGYNLGLPIPKQPLYKNALQNHEKKHYEQLEAEVAKNVEKSKILLTA